MRKFLQNKLWRDKVKVKHEKKGGVIHFKRLTDVEYDKALRRKLLEEGHEVGTAQSKEEIMNELADVLEVIDSLCVLHNLSPEKIKNIQNKTRDERGGFEQRIYVTIAEFPEGSFGEQYCLAQPEKYPEIKE